MELVERSRFLAALQEKFDSVIDGEGHCILVSGEAGIGKTSLIKAFCKDNDRRCKVYQGTCDALFTPRPLAPLYDIIWQLGRANGDNSLHVADRSELFAKFFHALEDQPQPSVIIIEDIHWADEATLDFIKFLARRITRFHSLFILTYRDDEIHSNHPVRTVVGQLSSDSFTRLQLVPLSREATEKLAEERGYKGEDVFSVTGGNPFYVNEILASYSTGIPDNIKDSILTVYNRLDEKTKQVWQILSILPTGFEISYLEKMEPLYAAAIHTCLEHKILVPKDGLIFFKHELYRRTIETSLSPLLRISLNKRILDLFLENFEQRNEIERIIHHAKNANEPDLVVKYAPLAAKQAASMGAHVEASRLWLSAIEYYQGTDKDLLNQFHESYAYECYLTNQVKDAIIYTTRSLNHWKKANDIEKTGNALRFLSRLWWYDGNRKKAEAFAEEAIQTLKDQPPTAAKAMAFSNMSQLKMLSDQPEECIAWGEKAIALAKELSDDEILCHALNNVGTIQMRSDSTRQEGHRLLMESLEIASRNSYHEHAARAYTNLGSNAVEMKDYPFARTILQEGIQYCEERDLDSWTNYLLGYTARLHLETGNWSEAYRIADLLVQNESLPPIVRIGALVIVATIRMRKGEGDVKSLLLEAREKAFETMEAQRIIPVLTASMEYEWLTNTTIIDDAGVNHAIELLEHTGNMYENSEFGFWCCKARAQKVALRESFEGYKVDTPRAAAKTAALWRKLGCPYEEAMLLFEGTTEDKKSAIALVQKLGADAIYEKLKFEMRASGIKNIPRGIRKSTSANPANLTDRELDVLQLLKEGLQNKEIASRLFISPKTVDHHISSILFKLDVNSRVKAVNEALQLEIIK